MYKLYVGNLSAKRQENWFCLDDDPYSVWEGDALICQICTIGTPACAGRILRDQIEVDWGSTAWKATKAELTQLFEECKLDRTLLKVLEKDKDYAVVFLETVWGDSA